MQSKRLLAIVIAFGLILAWGAPVWSADAIKIGVIGPMQFLQGKGH